MTDYEHIDHSYPRKDGVKKVNGEADYTDDYKPDNLLHAAVLTSPHAHAKIKSIDTKKAEESSGVRSVVTGKDFDIHTGIYLGDKRPLAKDKVRHYGERVAAVIADSEHEAKRALDLIDVDYETLESVSSPKEALKEDSPVLHENMEDYDSISAIHPEPGTNIGNRTKIRKGDTESGLEESDVVVEDTFEFKGKDHVAMEPRVTIAEIDSDDQVIVRTASQSPFVVRHSLSLYFDIPHNNIKVKTPFVGGGFGGKAGIYLEALAYLLSKEVNGKPVRLANSREEDLVSSPGSMGFEGEVKIGATEDGEIKAMDIRFLFDSGAYADYAVNISRAAAVSCTGPYSVPNVKADSLCVYTNHPYATAFRGFGHIEQGFAIERTLNLLADKINMDPAELRIKNAIKEGDTTPTDSPMDKSTGDLPKCIENVKNMLDWDEGQVIEVSENKIRAKGIGSLWKTPIIPPNTRSSIVVMFNEDG
ncbi:MAG: xanthine dehydrogenase family protein molybdopterin-binding subunit, partial [archaeon]